MDKPLLIVDQLSKRYKKHLVVDQFHLQAQRGEVIGLYGPNGAGKSTIIKLISGIIYPTAGKILVNGYDSVRHKKRYAQEISYMPDHFQFRQPLTVLEFLQFYARLRRMDLGKVFAALDRVGLISKKDAPIHTLSKGMGQRLLLAQTLFSGASLILLDEPTNGLDDEWLTNLKTIIVELKAENKTVIFSTHLHSFAAGVSDRMISVTPLASD